MVGWQNTSLTRTLGVEYPIVLGAFGGSSTAELTAAVSNAGGLGLFGAHVQAPDQMAPTADAIRALTDKPFGLNLWLSQEDPAATDFTQADYDLAVERLKPWFDEVGLAPPPMPERFSPDVAAQIAAAIAARPAVLSFAFGVPSAAILDQCRAAGIVTTASATTVAESIALDQAGVDLIIASGMEAGGHRVSFLAPAEDSLIGTMALVPQVVEAVRAPVIAAGGVADGRGIAACLMLGSAGAQIGTAFLACDESAIPEAHRRVLRSERARTTQLTRGFTGRLARGVPNRFMVEAGPPAPYPVQNWLTGHIRRAAAKQGKAELINLWAGQAAGLGGPPRATTLFGDLIRQTEAAFAAIR
ncbi:MAG: hypothetical protein JWM33_1829 [Caulobacteraceae bacterium]|nr:hypothetical protein [Caulobacteraceae bacterium]